jgi:AcrR family transcriptional regulator
MANPNSHSARGPDPRTSDRGPTESVDRLLDGAQATFAERGYRAASIHEICARSTVGIGTFYAHFDHKRDLLQRVFIDRAVLLSRILTPADLLDHGQLVASLRRTVDEPVAAGLSRAWYEAVLEEPAIARFHADWRASTLEDLAKTIAEAQRRAQVVEPRFDPSVVSWTIGTLSREMAIHDRKGAPDLETLARLIDALVFGSVAVDQAARSA